MDKNDGASFRMRRPNHLGLSEISEHRPGDCRSQKCGVILTEILSRIGVAARSPGLIAGRVYGNLRPAVACGLLGRGIFVVVGPVMDRLAGHLGMTRQDSFPIRYLGDWLASSSKVIGHFHHLNGFGKRTISSPQVSRRIASWAFKVQASGTKCPEAAVPSTLGSLSNTKVDFWV